MTLDFSQNFFELFGLPQRFAIEPAVLERSYREIQSQIHPDRFAGAGDAERRASMQWTTRVNEAYQTLKSPIRRAAYLLALHGIDPGFETNTAMPTDFLTRQMAWREAVEEASGAGDAPELDRLSAQLRGELDRLYADLAIELESPAGYPGAARTLRKLKFLEKVAEEIGDAHERLGT